jgi:hypothetical protein
VLTASKNRHRAWGGEPGEGGREEGGKGGDMTWRVESKGVFGEGAWG